ncbi:hypothetical protein VST7929_02063 [Vibrio stylophorae]|uniref:DUF2057 domain-containing protein n=1 Tax=Vibrio stylophorae TaxID=659351 RepID=A0ABM8ZV06_9VIBR|nr:DUF2057 domain-containing protein [Vibrio stylophorae]CAH0534155.1 hypothetical protein VST7929_02063 [Vibrio stylophorae]
MKLIRSTFLMASLLCSFSTFAAVTVKLHQDLEPVLIDGEEVGLLTFGSQREIELPDGMNQLVVRVAKLVPSTDGFEKFNSSPVVITFNASNQEILVEPSIVIQRLDQLKRYKANPQMTVKDTDGKPFSVHQGVLMRGKGLMRDYEEELETYNKVHNYSFNTGDFSVTAAMPVVESTPAIQVDGQTAPAAKQPQTTVQSKDFAPVTDFSAPMQAMYLQMTPEQRQAFLSWAVQNVN